MAMEIKGEKVKFPSGDELYFNAGVCGITLEDDALVVYEGFDGEVVEADDLAPAAREEFAGHMMRRWAAWGGLAE